MTKDYYGTKRITAWPQRGENDIDGYAVKYADGYVSWSPADVFEAAYQPITAMNFGHALAALMDGHRVARDGWNGKGMWIDIHAPQTLSRMSLPYIFMKTADNHLVPWLASQTDLLAEDWTVLPLDRFVDAAP